MATHTAAKPRKPILSRDRAWTHAALLLGTLIGCVLAFIYDPSGIIAEPLALGLGYVSLVYLVASLLIGPLYLARQKRNPVNLYIRRDIGIWAGLTALVHVFFSLKLYAGGEILLYFFGKFGSVYLPEVDLFGLSNWLGLLAAVIITVLLVLSNDWSLRRLKGKRWKRIQQWTYPLIVLTILHTLGYQIYNERDGLLYGSLAGLVALTAAAQGIGYLVHKRRERQRELAKAQPKAGAMPAKGPAAAAAAAAVAAYRPAPLRSISPVALDGEGLSRRRFLIMGGSALAAVALISLKVTEELIGPADSGLPVLTSANPVPANTNLSSPTAAALAQAPASTEAAPSPTAVAEAPAQPTAEPPTQVPPKAQAVPTDTAAPVAAAPTDTPAPVAAAPTDTPADTNSGGVVLTTLAALPVGGSVTFTTPDTGETGILVHEADGSVKAFSNVCTHRPYPVQYDSNSELLVCPLHMACFNATSGSVTRGPARRPLASIPVHVDSKGNVLYG